jgi:hypothetical protein
MSAQSEPHSRQPQRRRCSQLAGATCPDARLPPLRATPGCHAACRLTAEHRPRFQCCVSGFVHGVNWPRPPRSGFSLCAPTATLVSAQSNRQQSPTRISQYAERRPWRTAPLAALANPMRTPQPVKTGNCALACADLSRDDARWCNTRNPGLAQETVSSRPAGDDVRHVRHFPGYQEPSELEGSH